MIKTIGWLLVAFGWGLLFLSPVVAALGSYGALVTTIFPLLALASVPTLLGAMFISLADTGAGRLRSVAAHQAALWAMGALIIWLYSGRAMRGEADPWWDARPAAAAAWIFAASVALTLVATFVSFRRSTRRPRD